MGIEVTVGKSDTDTEYSSAVAIQKMMKSIILVSLAVLALSSATTISIENGQVCGLNVEACSSKPVPSAGEIELIRESWPVIKKNKNVLAEFVLEHFRVHPKTQELLPELAGIALADLPNNAYFVQLSETYVVLATNEIVDNLDNAGVLSKLLECLHPEWYVDYVSIDRQNDETLRIWYKVLEEQMGNELSQETKDAWRKGMNYAFTFLKMRPSQSHINSALSVKDVQLVRKFYAAHRDNIAIVNKALLKMFTQHPEAQKLVPALAGVPVNKLEENEDFQVLAYYSSAVATFIVTNLDQEDILTHILVQQTKPEQFVDYIDPIYQLDETAHVILSAIREMVPVDEETNKALENVMSYVNGIMAQKVAPNSDTKSIVEPVVSAKNKGLIRATWDQMRFNSNIAPKIMLKMFSAYPETQKMFPRIADVPVSELMKNRKFLSISYSAFAGFSFIINNLDDTEMIQLQLSKVDFPGMFVFPFPGSVQQHQQTSRIVLEVFAEELGAAFTAEAASAWTSLLDFVSEGLVNNVAVTPLSAADHTILKDNLKMINKDSNFGARAVHKMLLAHPKTISIFPQFANQDIATLMSNPEFLATGKMIQAGFEFFVNNLDEPNTVKRVLSHRPFENYFVSYVSIPQQLEDTTRYVIESLDEELGARFTPATRNVWKRACNYANSIMEEVFQ